ncbi:efflux RND transporter periplasmic adaptor subunit [Pseudomarimonas arenosa]|uniref:Efflux RND transporter periplasmic adaptor subunit n=1 Tax=Pseudomarimonas arenosa TaxID=2774145 RepID=A0AAW3ZJ29_9GAMM|nr:efflux RND transporter periplasmic adaptor subunit [Pseudomarimonas arenosa]MBD8526080.1 efflux RND transporter periplasmic adaptor subunit [Pseudomarimonas arenosa]
MNKTLVLLTLSAAVLVACGKAAVPTDLQSAEPQPLLLVEQDVLVAEASALSQGPVISGSLQPELRADLRAEVAGIVLDVLKDNGDEVAKGDVLLRLDPTAIRDKLLSAQEAERAAKVALEQSERQFKRMQSMVKQGMVAVEAVETAEGKRNQAQSELASAHARVVEARQQLEKTEVRAPFAGVVGSRTVSPGDTAQVGMQLLSVLDIDTMRFEGMVAADQIGKVETGAPVRFRINGFAGQEFEGQVQRVNPVANEATRQVQVLVALSPQAADRLVAGLYAEGRIDVSSRPAIMLPESSLLRDGDTAFVWQVLDANLRRQQVSLGERDARLGRVEITSGLSAGDRVLRHPLGSLKDGAPVEFSGDAPAGSELATAAVGE